MIVIPLLGSVLNGLVLRPVHPSARKFSLAAAGLSFVAAVVLSWNYSSTGQIVSLSFEWLRVGGLTSNWGFRFDAITVLMSLVVTYRNPDLASFSRLHGREPTRTAFRVPESFFCHMLIFATGANLP
ncbi:MAG: hypothetical protein R3B54_17060 [Bdellovibrionota bacterium]